VGGVPLTADDVDMQGCKTMIAIEAAKLGAKPDPDSAYWN